MGETWRRLWRPLGSRGRGGGGGGGGVAGLRSSRVWERQESSATPRPLGKSASRLSILSMAIVLVPNAWMVVAAARSTVRLDLSVLRGAELLASRAPSSTIVAVSGVGIVLDGSAETASPRRVPECLATNLVRASLLAADLRGAMRRIMPKGSPSASRSTSGPAASSRKFVAAILNISLGRRCARIRSVGYVI
jgi:hypothetical protein